MIDANRRNCLGAVDVGMFAAHMNLYIGDNETTWGVDRTKRKDHGKGKGKGKRKGKDARQRRFADDEVMVPVLNNLRDVLVLVDACEVTKKQMGRKPTSNLD